MVPYDMPDSKVHGANMGPTWVLSAPDGPHVGPMNLAIRDIIHSSAATEVELRSDLNKWKTPHILSPDQLWVWIVCISTFSYPFQYGMLLDKCCWDYYFGIYD